MKLSKKKEDELYGILYNEIVDTRIQINKILKNSKELNEIDNLLFKLNVEVPKKAIEIIKK